MGEMALQPSTLEAAILASFSFSGSRTMPWIARAVGQAFATWAPTVVFQGATTGFAGSGLVTGKVFLQGSGLVPAAMAGVGLSSVGVEIGRAIEAGIVETVQASAQYAGASAGVGTGSDVSSVRLVSQAGLLVLLTSALRGAQIEGLSSSQLAAGISAGVAALTRTCTGVGVVAGANAGVPGAGTSLSAMF